MQLKADISQDENNYGDTGYNDDYPYAVYATRTPPEYSVTAENITYGETLAPVVENNTYNVEVTYSYTGTDGQPIEGLPTAAGTHTVTATFAKYVDGANKLYYPSTSVEFTVEIAHRQLTIDSVEVTVSTDDSGTPTATVTYLSISGMEEGDDVTVTATVTEVTGSAESGWKVQVTYSLSGEDAGNYIAPEASYINVTNDLGSAVSALEAAIEELKEDIGTVDGTDLQTQITNINGLITAAVDSFDGLTDTTADISDLAGGLAQLISQLETLKDTVATINSDYITGTGLETALGTLQNTIETAFEEADGKLQTAIDSINTALTEAIDKVDELLSADGTTVDSATLAEALANLIDAYKAADDALATDISGDMTELENTLIEADKALDIAIKGVQENLDKAVKDLEEAIAAKADSAALTQAINGLTTAYKAADELINADIDVIESDISGLESKLDETQTTLQESINTVQNNLESEIERLEELINSGGADTSGLENALAALDEAYKAADALIRTDFAAADDALAGEIAADLAGLEASLESADEAIWEAIEALQAAVDGNSSDIDGLTTALWIIGAVAVIALAGAAAGIVLALRKKNK